MMINITYGRPTTAWWHHLFFTLLGVLPNNTKGLHKHIYARINRWFNIFWTKRISGFYICIYNKCNNRETTLKMVAFSLKFQILTLKILVLTLLLILCLHPPHLHRNFKADFNHIYMYILSISSPRLKSQLHLDFYPDYTYIFNLNQVYT